MREIVMSLGPTYVKLSQAPSIRPDILSPAAMTKLQKLCDKVPSFPNDITMALLEEENCLPPDCCRLRIGAVGLNRAPCTTRVSAFEKAVRLFTEKPTDNVITLVLETVRITR
ncbi:uncharacterized protein sll0005-like isoform X1 [Triticum dicoccoides]|uniref:uncharacterized protein sll0005-like isoform X1 n=1 Tax=Triticum dicoccoides TaxID=85692 RepID=UPI00188F545D|nr:uncharacterized protein sll0005-like isoform X1 [Triticum dicoccoides]XP_037483804.1 uncharacterized protein sll0005-like isoform X1 [Triticum dicoccoides]